MCIRYMCQVLQDPFLKIGVSSLLWRLDIIIKLGSNNDFLTTYGDSSSRGTVVYRNATARNNAVAYVTTYSR